MYNPPCSRYSDLCLCSSDRNDQGLSYGFYILVSYRTVPCLKLWPMGTRTHFSFLLSPILIWFFFPLLVKRNIHYRGKPVQSISFPLKTNPKIWGSEITIIGFMDNGTSRNLRKTWVPWDISFINVESLSLSDGSFSVIWIYCFNRLTQVLNRRGF